MTTYARPVALADQTAPLPTAAGSRIRLTILSHAVVLGVAGDLLMREPGSGIAFPLWVALLALSVIALTWRNHDDISREAGFWLCTAVVFAAFVAWRASEVLLAMDVLATIGALGMAAIALADERAALFAQRLRETLWAGVDVVLSVASGILPLLSRAMTAPDVRATTSSRVRPAVRAALIVFALLVVFGSLLRGADPIFASLVELPDIDVGEIVSHTFVIGFYAWLVAGFARGALRVDRDTPHAPDTLPFSFGSLDVTAALTTLIVLFATFLVSQLGWLFGGERFLHERTGLTAATYARQGFFQLVFAIALVLPVLMLTRAGMRGDSALRRRHTALSLPLIVLLGATMLSAIGRMKLYVHYYGLTTDRLYPLVFMAWLAVVLIWFACTVLRDVPQKFVGGALITGALMLAALNVSQPDAFIARVNLDRAANTPARTDSALDLVYLATLSGAAVPLAVQATLDAGTNVTAEQRCAAARELHRRWGAASRSRLHGDDAAAWRYWNADEAQATKIVVAHSAELRTLQHETCGRREAAAPSQPR